MGKLKIYLGIFFVALAIPIAVLLNRSFDQLQSERLLATKDRADLILQSLNRTLQLDLQSESERSYSEYRYLRAIPVLGGEEVALSPLAEFPAKTRFQGLLGHFQIEPDGQVRSPFVPDGPLALLKIKTKPDRLIAKDKIERLVKSYDILDVNVIKRVKTRTLNISGVEIEGAQIIEVQDSDENDEFSTRIEQSSKKQDFVFEVETEMEDAGLEELSSAISPRVRSDRSKDILNESKPASTNDMVKVFGVEVHPFNVVVGDRHLIFHRNVFRGGERYVQGFVVNAYVYLNSIMRDQIHRDNFSDLGIDFSRNFKPLMMFRKQDVDYDHIFNSQLTAPFSQLSIHVGLPSGGLPPGAHLIYLLGVLIALLLGMGLLAIYKLADTHVTMSRKRSDFISAVSHELKTPLTAIRMYCEMLESGFVADDAKRQTYYSKISGESNRLSRLIQNVLDLSKIERNTWKVELKPYQLGDLIREYRETFLQSFTQRDFEIHLDLKKEITVHMIDKDAFFQILVNIVENAIKFSMNSENKVIDIHTRLKDDYTELRIRDYGPGVPSGEASKIFDVFYRVEDELVRNTTGTGIGLSLVKRFCDEMEIKIDAKNANPGLMMVLYIPVAKL